MGRLVSTPYALVLGSLFLVVFLVSLWAAVQSDTVIQIMLTWAGMVVSGTGALFVWACWITRGGE